MRKKIVLSISTILALFLAFTFLKTEKGIKIAAADTIKAAPAADWAGMKNSAVSDLRALLRIQSIRGNELAVCRLLQSILKKEQIASRIISYPGKPDRASLIAELPGSQPTGGLILTGHMDVVEANADDWDHPPYSADMRDGRIHGRGAVDMKGMLMMELYAFLSIHRAKIPLKRKLMFLAIADEESRSIFGAQFLTQKHPEIFTGYEYVLNEGGIGTVDVAVPGAKIFNLQYAEKGLLWLKLKSKGDSGHGSTPPVHYAALDLMHFFQDLENMEKGTTITDETAAFFYQVGEASSFPNSFVLKRSRNPLIKPLLDGFIQSNRHLRAMTSNTRSFTGFQTEASGTNVIAARAAGKVDIRLLPGVTPEQFTERVKKIAEPYGIEVEVEIADPPTVSPIDGELFQVLARVAMNNVPGSHVTPFLSPGTTDSTYLRRLGLKCYGLIPGIFTSDDIDGMHGKNESITVDNLMLGMKIIYETIAAMN